MNKFLLLLLLCLSSCSLQDTKQETQKNTLIESLSSTSDNTGFSKADKVIDFVFPKDHFSHKDFKTEWWYLTGNLETEEGRKFGYQFTIFRNALSPKTSSGSGWASNQVYMGHLGLSDIKTNEFYSFELLEREAIGLAGIQEEPFRLWIDNWKLESDSPGIFPLKLHAAENGVEINLELEASKAIILQGDQGLSQKTAEKGNASYYYSIPRLASQGNIRIKDKEYKVKGDSWLDREWSTSALSQEQEGWDWFALQFADNTELMYYQLRNKDGSSSQTSSGSYIKADGEKEKIKYSDLELIVLDHWQSGEHRYPAKWRLKIQSRGIDIIIEPLMKAQEHRFYIPYWEGAVKITSKDSNKEGRGYVELTGY